MVKVVTSFGSAYTKPGENLYADAELFGKYFAEAGYSLCSGGYYGTMEAISKGARNAGGKTTGITVKNWKAVPNDFIDETVVMPNLMERIVELVVIADIYIIFKGGTGTLLEISAALELMNKKAMPEKKMIFYTEFWKNMIDILRQDSNELNSLISRNISFINKPHEVLTLL